MRDSEKIVVSGMSQTLEGLEKNLLCQECRGKLRDSEKNLLCQECHRNWKALKKNVVSRVSRSLLNFEKIL